MGILHGVPFSVKEMFNVAGTPTTGGLTSLRDHTATEDAELVQRLRQVGGILLGKTNLGQLGVMYETDNPVYGRTNNPWSEHHSPGGSSGGDAALVAVGGARFGLGSDRGGSVRQPAHSCGIQSLKPTAGRLPLHGHFVHPTLTADHLQAGLMARRVDDLEIVLRTLLSKRSTSDRSASWHIPFHDPAHIDVGSLRIGVCTDDGIFRPSPSIRRAVKEAAAALAARGAHVETFCPYDPWLAWSIYFRLFYADGLTCLRKRMGNDKCDWRVRRIMRIGAIPSLSRPALHLAFQCLAQRFPSKLFGSVSKKSISAGEYCDLLAIREEYRNHFQRCMDASRLDVILAPVSGLPALPHGSFHGAVASSYTFLYNLLGMPAGVVSTTRVRPGEESDRVPGWDVCEQGAKKIEEKSTGMPLGVQVIGHHWREDVVLAVMKGLEEDFIERPDFPSNPKCMAL